MQVLDYEHFLPFQARRFLARWERVEAEELDRLELTSPQFWILLVVHRQTELTVSDIANLLQFDQTTVSRTVDTLVKRRLVERRISQTDLRQRLVTVAARGRRTRRDAGTKAASPLCRAVGQPDRKPE